MILGTYVWVFLYGLFNVLFASELPQSKFRETMWCKPGDWVLDTFQPMVSDARMIRHINANRADMEKAALMISNKTYVAYKVGLTPEFKALMKSINMTDPGGGGLWPTNPYDNSWILEQERCVRDARTMEARGRDCLKENRSRAALKPDFGRTWAQYFCTDNRNSNKGYLYFPAPAPAPRIKDGQLLGIIGSDGTHGSMPLLVSNTDRNIDGGSIVRQIDAHWFIYRN